MKIIGHHQNDNKMDVVQIVIMFSLHHFTLKIDPKHICSSAQTQTESPRKRAEGRVEAGAGGDLPRG